MIKRILVALSGTPYTPSAVRHALDLAEAHKAELTGVTVLDSERLAEVGPVPIGGGAAAHGLAEHRLAVTREHVEEQITDFEAVCRETTMIHNVVRETGDPLDQLADLSRYNDLVVFGLRGLFDYGVLENPDDEIVRMLRAGVRPILAAAVEHRPIQRVLIAYNGSTVSARALKHFVQSGLWPDAALKIATFGLEEDTAAALLRDAAAYCRSHGYEPEVERMPPYPEEGLLNQAHHWQADLVVLGAQSRSKFAKFFLGDTVLHVMQHADVPLFLA